MLGMINEQYYWYLELRYKINTNHAASILLSLRRPSLPLRIVTCFPELNPKKPGYSNPPAAFVAGTG